MNAQLCFSLSRATDPLSSHAAADAIRPVHADQCDRVYRFLTLHPGSTARELAASYWSRHGGDDPYPMFHKRLPDLRKTGRAINGDMRRCRIGSRLSQTWSATNG